MESKIIINLLGIIGIKEPTEADFQRVVETLRLDKLPRKIKLLLFIAIPMVKGYLEYFLNPEKPLVDD